MIEWGAKSLQRQLVHASLAGNAWQMPMRKRQNNTMLSKNSKRKSVGYIVQPRTGTGRSGHGGGWHQLAAATQPLIAAKSERQAATHRGN